MYVLMYGTAVVFSAIHVAVLRALCYFSLKWPCKFVLLQQTGINL